MKTYTVHFLALFRIRCLFAVLFSLLMTNFVDGQPMNINLSTLIGDYWYRRDAAPSLPMHNLTSRSVVMISASPRPDLPEPGIGSAYFIQTREDLPFYCMLTAAHNLYPEERFTKTDEVIGVNMSFRLTYINPTENPATYTYNGYFESRPISVTVANATILGHRDFAVLKVPKLSVVATRINLHGIDMEVPRILPANRLSDEPMHSLYTIHHSDGRPQLLSTLRNSDYEFPREDIRDETRPKDYLEAWGIHGMEETTYGASGSPLVLPENESDYSDAPAIGIYVQGHFRRINEVELEKDAVFYRLSNSEVKKAIKAACFGKKQEDPLLEYVKSRIPNPIAESIKFFIPQLDTILEEVAAVHDATVNEKTIIPMGLTDKMQRNGTEIAEKVITLKQQFSKKNISDEQLLNTYDKLEKLTPKYLSDVQEATRSEMQPQDFQPDRLADTFDFLVDGASSTLENFTFHLVPHGFQILSTKLYSSFDKLANSFGRSSSSIRAKRENQASLMKAPSELTDLRSSVLDLVALVNQRYTKSIEYETRNRTIFQGVELFYQNQDEYSNLFLLEHFYQDEYLVTNFILSRLEEDLKKAQAVGNMKQFVTDFTAKLKTVKSRLKALKAKKYPSGFFTFPNDQLSIKYQYYHFLDNSKKYTITPPNQAPGLLTWQNLDLKYETAPNSFGYQDILAGSTIKRKDIPSGMTNNTNEYISQELLSTYSTKFKVMGSLDLDQINPTLHPNLQNFLKHNGLTLKNTGKLIKVKSTNKETVTFPYAFAEEKVPPRVSNAFTTHITNFLKTTTLSPQIDLSANVKTGVVKFELNSPEILVISRAFRKVETPKGSNTGHLENERNEANDYVGQSLVDLSTFATRRLSLSYGASINEVVAWNFDLDLAAPVAPISPGRYQIMTPSNPGRSNAQYLQVAPSDQNHRRYSELPWVETLAEPNANAPEQIVTVKLNPDGQTYSLAHESMGSTPYLSRSGYYTQLIGDYSYGFMFNYAATADSPQQKWAIRPSSKDGFYQILEQGADSDNTWFLTAEYDSDYQTAMASLYRQSFNTDQDWTFIPVTPKPAARLGTPDAEARELAKPSLYPNPVQDQLTVNLPGGYSQNDITVVTVTGTILSLPKRIQPGQCVIDVQSLAAGIYFVHIQAEGKPKQVLKFLKP